MRYRCTQVRLLHIINRHIIPCLNVCAILMRLHALPQNFHPGASQPHDTSFAHFLSPLRDVATSLAYTHHALLPRTLAFRALGGSLLGERQGTGGAGIGSGSHVHLVGNRSMSSNMRADVGSICNPDDRAARFVISPELQGPVQAVPSWMYSNHSRLSVQGAAAHAGVSLLRVTPRLIDPTVDSDFFC